MSGLCVPASCVLVYTLNNCNKSASCTLLLLWCLLSCLQDFFAKDMGLPLTMTPNYDDFSCQ
jgi:hypothetical protein